MQAGFLVHSAVEAWARETPDAPAMIFQGEAQSYVELLAASQQLAAALIDGGLQRSDRVGIFMRKGLALGPAIYGSLMAGGAFVPLDPAVPIERLEFMLRDCGIRHVVTTDAMAPALLKLGQRMEGSDAQPTLYGVEEVAGFDVVSPTDLLARPRGLNGVWVTDQDLAYIMYTSGSTGEPKGMMHSHRGSLSYARWGQGHVRLTSDDRVASHAPLHFDLSIFDFFSTAQAGGAVVLVPEAVTKFPASWTELLEKERVSVVFTVPFTLIEMLERGALEQRDLARLRWVLFGGEAFPPKHLRALMERLPQTKFTNVYGPAEAPSCTCYDVQPIALGDETPISIGTVSVGSDDLILGEDDEPVELGATGELCIRSTTLTLGYWNRPELNHRAFFTRPSLGHFPDVYFRTGDLVARGEDGQLAFLGRKDRMVKTRGHRVELDEVEAALASHPAVLEAASYTVADGGGSRSIFAAVTAAVGGLDPGALRQHVREKLPPYAVPREITILQDFPRTTSGKIDRRALADASPSPSDVPRP